MFGFGEELTKENILKRISSFELFSHYIGEGFVANELINSPLREDNKPSFLISNKYSKEGEFYFKDFRFGNGDVISFVRYKYNLTYPEALKVINNDFGLGLGFEKINHRPPLEVLGIRNPKKKNTFDLRIKSRPFNQKDADYWQSYGISKKLLVKANIKPLKKFWMFKNGKEIPILCKTITYAYCFGGHKYKVYQPLYKNFITNCNEYQGLHLLPKAGKIVVITKSMKDVLVLTELGIPSFAPPSESIIVSSSIMNRLNKVFYKTYSLSDYDNTGIHFGWEMRRRFRTEPLFLTDSLWNRGNGYRGAKDISDFYKLYGKEETKEVLKKLIKK